MPAAETGSHTGSCSGVYVPGPKGRDVLTEQMGLEQVHVCMSSHLQSTTAVQSCACFAVPPLEQAATLEHHIECAGPAHFMHH